jgi:hypothetical protein
MNRQTVTYKILSELMYQKPAAGVLGQILGYVAYFCTDNNLSPLTAIVVTARGGIPGHSIPVDPSKIDKLREKVYAEDWYDIYPPNEDELSAAFNKSR